MDKSQTAKLSLIAILFLITPLLSTSIRSSYLYFVINILIIALSAEAGLLSSSSNHPEDKKLVASAPKPVVVDLVVTEPSLDKGGATNGGVSRNDVVQCTEKKAKVIEKSASEKIAEVVKVHMVKKCPSMPSLFFIGGDEAEVEATMEDEEEEEEVEGLSGQELFTKAETFIGNFYKQLKIQREDSWKKIHGFYHKTF